MKQIDVAASTGKTHLLGLTAGKQALGALSADAALLGESLVVLDLRYMELITASAARESILALAAALAEQGKAIAVTNANAETMNELAFAADALKAPLLVADALAADGPPRGRLIGSLDQKQRETLQVVSSLGEADTRAACEAADAEDAGVTAWNNRLAGLASKGLLRERRAGKTKFYRLALEGIADGN